MSSAKSINRHLENTITFFAVDLRLRVVVVLVWMIAAVCGTPYLFFYGTVEIQFSDMTFCLMVHDYNMKAFSVVNFLLFYIIPLILMSILYTQISLVLWRTSRQGNLGQEVMARNTQRATQKPLINKRIKLMVFKSKKKQDKEREYNSVPNIVVIGAGPLPSCDSSPKHALSKGEVEVNVDALHKYVKPGETESYSFCVNSDDELIHDLSSPETQRSNTIHSGHIRNGENGQLVEKLHKAPVATNIQHSMNSTRTVNTHRENRRPMERSYSNPSEPRRKEGALVMRRKVIRLLMAVLISFSICVLPYHIRVLYSTWSEPTVSFIGAVMVPVTFVIYYTNSGLNPILYAFLSDNFRKSLKDIITCKRGGRQSHVVLRGTVESMRTNTTSL